MILLRPPDKGGGARSAPGGFRFSENQTPRSLSAHDPLIRGSAVALLLALLASFLAWAIDVPPLKARVTDLTTTLSAQQRASLEQTLAEFEARKGAQLAVLIVPTTQPETIEQYAVRVEEAWKLGRKGVDDSVLLVIAKDDRRLHFEVGYGL
ncbi:MAG TPA: TPM domain-containing protein, partial [Burkholderiales bacterium]|nr:TPM domain-containing protein [Burkholderiales bacterium]